MRGRIDGAKLVLEGRELARQTENLADTLDIDVSAWAAKYEGAVYDCYLRRADSTIVQPANGAAAVDGLLSIDITSAMTAIPGVGQVEIRARVGDVVAISASASVLIRRILDGSAPGETQPTWVVAAAASAAAAAASAASAAAAQAAVTDLSAHGPKISEDGYWALWDAEAEDYVETTVQGYLTQGPPGLQGETGPAGPAGPKGDKGDKGDTGAQGLQGPQGATGPKGDTGERGADGAPGAQGPKGDTGDTGPAGPAGPQGEAGPAGPQGEAGPAGPQGETGPTGPRGATGERGLKGDTGTTGPTVTRAAFVEDDIVFTKDDETTVILADAKTTLTGPQGEQGPQGIQGPKGDTGDPGEVSQAQMESAISAAVEPVTAQLADVMSDVQRIDNALAPLSLNIDSWKSVQQVVKAGLAPKAFPIGTQLLMSHSVYGDRLYDVVAHDYLKSVHDQNAHTMTLLQHDLLPALQFDASEAFYYAEVALPAGKYNFTIATTYVSWLAGTYEFTLTQAIPVGGQLAISGYADADMTARQVRSFASRTTTTVTESVAITSGNEGTNLGTFGVELNYSQRVSYGSNNYKESAMRQFLNSSAAAGSVWQPQTKFDRPPDWVSSLAGFVGGLDADFLSIIGDVVLPCATNSTYEAPDSTTPVNTEYNLHDKFYLASRNEVFDSQDGVADDSVLFPCYTDATNADRIKYLNGSAAYWWVRTPHAGDTSTVRRVGLSGTVGGDYAAYSRALAPACTIV